MASTFSFFLSTLLTVALVAPPGGVYSLTGTSSKNINRNFTCPDVNSNPLNRLPCEHKTKTLYIQGFVPANNSVFNSETIVPAAYLAIDDINANCSLLRNYTLQLDFVNTLCDPSEATWQLIDSIVIQNNTEQPKIAFLGGGCSLATEPVAALSGRFYKIPQISYGASSPSLSKRDLFPRFVRTIPSEIQANTARLALMRKYKWSKVATLHETQTIFSLAVEDFHMRYDIIYNSTSENEEDLILRSFTDDPEIPLGQIKDKDVRIIFGYFYEDKAVTVLCQAFKLGLTSDNNLWMFPAWFTEGWWNTDSANCTKEDMRNAVRYSFFLDSHLYGTDKNATTDTGTKSANEFDVLYDCYLSEFRENPQSMQLTTSTSLPHIYRTFSYDAVWTIGQALDKADRDLEEKRNIDSTFNLTLDDYAYFDENNISQMISENMETASFNGISGNVRFDSSGTRVGLNAIYQLVNGTGSEKLELQLLAVHDPSLSGSNSTDNDNFNFTFAFDVEPTFKTGSHPNDRRTPINIYLNSFLIIFCCGVTTIALIVALGLLIFNLVTLFKPLIRDSAPHINNVIIIGCILMLTTCYLLSIDSGNPRVSGDKNGSTDAMAGDAIEEARNSRYTIICHLRLWFLTIGFTLSFGALFAKTWQVYRVYTNPKLQKEKFKMWNFLLIIGIFLFIDVAYLTFWTATYPFSRGSERRIITDPNNDVENIYELCECQNFPYLIGALYVYKGLLVVFGLFLAYESRNVKYYYINDSRFVSIAMYIVVILVGIGAPLSLVLAVHYFIDPAYGLGIFMIIASCLSCLLILFVPKFVFMARGKDTMVRENSREEIAVSDGLQLGRTTIDQTEVQTIELEVTQLKQNNAEKSLELQNLEGQVVAEGGVEPSKPARNGSDGDSGVLVTDDNDIFNTESTTNGEQRHMLNTPSPLIVDEDVVEDVDDIHRDPELTEV